MDKDKPSSATLLPSQASGEGSFCSPLPLAGKEEFSTKRSLLPLAGKEEFSTKRSPLPLAGEGLGVRVFFKAALISLPLLWIACMLISLKFGWLNKFFWAAEYADVQGVDYFALPKSFLNLLDHRSMFDTWGGAPYGPHATWYLAHPAFSVFVMSWFSYLSPWNSYFAFVIFSLFLMIYAAHLFAEQVATIHQKLFCYCLMLCAFPLYWMLYVGNMHAPLVLATTLILIGIYEMHPVFARSLRLRANARQSNPDRSELYQTKSPINSKLLSGLLLSLLSKPIVLLLIPAFLIAKETRKTIIIALIIYISVSVLFIVVPFLNPEGIGLPKLLAVIFDFDYIKATMNIYKNQYHLTEYMKDNSIHWLNLIAQSGFRLNHIENFSFPVFMDSLMGHQLSERFYQLPILCCLQGSLFLFFVQNQKTRINLLLILTMMVMLSFFLSYNTVWEYQFTSVLPVVAMVYLLYKKGLFTSREYAVLLFLSLFLYLPSSYILLDPSNFNIILLRGSRIIPVLLIFIVMTIKMLRMLRSVKSECAVHGLACSTISSAS